MALIESTVPRLDRNQAGIDELEELARKFAEFRQFWPARLTSIENVLSSTLGAEAGARQWPPGAGCSPTGQARSQLARLPGPRVQGTGGCDAGQLLGRH